MKKNGILTGLVIGGILGVAISLFTVQKVKGSSQKNKDSKPENIQLEPLNKKGNKSSSEEKKSDANSAEKSIVEFFNKHSSEETSEKPENKEGETRNTEREEKMKAEKEGTSMVEDIASKISFSKKIAQLEESLKKLREENTQ